jgi:hypothetical protein
MRHGRWPVLERICHTLHAQLDDVVRQPLPDRWVDLMYRLDEKRQAERLSQAHPTSGPDRNARA